MTLKTILFDGAPGVALNTANTGASTLAGQAAGLNTAVFSADAAFHGTTGAQFATVSGGNAAGSFARFTLDNGTTEIAQTLGFVVPATKPTANMPFTTFRASAARSVQLQYTTDGRLQFLDKVNVITDVATAAQLPVGGKFYIAWRVFGASTTAGTAIIEVRALDGSVVTSKTITTANVTVDPFVATDLGVIGSMQGTLLIDDVQTDTGRTTLIPSYAPPANVAPTVSAGNTQDVSLNSVVTLTGTATDPDNSIASRLWTAVSWPGSTAPVITNGQTATATFTPTLTGRYEFQFTATDDAGATSTPSIVRVYVRDVTARPVGVTSNSGPWSGVVQSLTDNTDSTTVDSPETATTEANYRVRLAPLRNPATFALTVRSVVSADSAGVTKKVRLYEGNTLRKEWTSAASTTLATETFTLTTAEISTITNWLALDVEFSYKTA
jgi:hypothetical protein